MKIIVKNNNLYGDQDALDRVKQLQANAISLPSYLHDVTSFLTTLGVSIQYDSVPSNLDAHIKGDKTFIGWKGTISGISKNTTSGSHLYGPGFKTWSSHPETFTKEGINYQTLYIGNAESCTGGGVDPFAYHSDYIIHIDTFPKIVNEYSGLQTDKFKKDLQLQFDETISNLIHKFENDYKIHNKSFMDDNKVKLTECNNQVIQAGKVIAKCREIIADIQARADNHATAMASFQLPEPPSALINLHAYTELSKKLLKTEKQLDAEHIAQLTTDIQKLVDDNIQLLI